MAAPSKLSDTGTTQPRSPTCISWSEPPAYFHHRELVDAEVASTDATSDERAMVPRLDVIVRSDAMLMAAPRCPWPQPTSHC